MEIAKFSIKKIVNSWEYSKIDLLASRNNIKINKFFSWKRGPKALAIDAFTLNWKNSKFYTFSSFSIILKVLQKINDGACGFFNYTLNWSSQFWLKHPFARQLSLVTRKLCG